MTPDRWRVVTDIFHAALARTRGERTAFVAEACRGDASLCADVEQLLLANDNVGSFGDAPAFATAGNSLASGTSLGHYRIEALIGRGGMGEVYRATDMRLDRSVALKILPSHLRSSTELQSRFQREARAISQLAHPHICTLHDVGRENGVDFLVMELLEGDLLATRLVRGPIPIDQALRIGIEIAGALDHAHRHGVVHRDLKPGNVMLTKSGTKLLDFGLAKFGLAAHAAAASSATLREGKTTEGTLLGTLPYMAPEQLEGKEADARSDIWALGCLLYELVTGRRAFDVDSQAGLIAAIMEGQPELLEMSLPPLASPPLVHVMRVCLAKEPDARWQSAADLHRELEWVASPHSAVEPQSVDIPRRTLPLAIGAFVAGSAATALLLSAFATPHPQVEQIARVMLDAAPAAEVNSGGLGVWMNPGGSRTALAWTPDGALIFVGRRGDTQHLYRRDLRDREAHQLAGTDNAQVPAVSPDGTWIAYWAQQAIRKTPAVGGPTSVLVRDIFFPPTGMSWNEKGELLYEQSDQIWIATPGSDPHPVTSRQPGEHSHTLPFWLPDGRVFMYTVRTRDTTWGEEQLVAQVRSTGVRIPVLSDAIDGRYAGRHLFFLRAGTLFGVPFDTASLKVGGQPVPLQTDVAQALTASNAKDVTGAGQFSIGPAGELAFIESRPEPYPERSIVVVDRKGIVTALSVPTRTYTGGLRLAPDGGRLAVGVQTTSERGLWIVDLLRGVPTKITPRGEVSWAVWTPDGRRLMFNWLDQGRIRFASQVTDRSAPPERLGDESFNPSSVSPDGRDVIGYHDDDIWVYTLSGPTKGLHPLWQSGAIETHPTLSPDGHWLAYASNESGDTEVYVRSYPGPGPITQISFGGGSSPAWNPNGRELFFVGPALGSPQADALDLKTRQQMFVVGIAGGSPLGTPRVLFDFQRGTVALACVPLRCYDVSPDGQRFFTWQPTAYAARPPVAHINVVFNWLNEVRKTLTTERATTAPGEAR